MYTEQDIQKLQQWIEESTRIVFFGGAGVSTESGIQDFRSEDGLYRSRYRYPPEVILSHHFFMQKPEDFFDFYREKMLCLSARPNAAHYKLAELEQTGKLTAVITQNIDGLHQMAGSKQVLELHGSIHRNFCMECGREYPAAYIKQTTGIPRCSCHKKGIIKPDVVLYEESLDAATLRQAIHSIQEADMLIVGGTSLAVYPAAGLLNDYQGHKLVLINRSSTPYDDRADLQISGSIGRILGQLSVP